MSKENPVKAVTPVVPGRFGLASEVFNTFALTAPEGTTKKQLLDPTFYSLVATKLRPWDRIIVMYQYTDGTYMAELLVVESWKSGAKMELLDFVELDKEAFSAGNEVDGYIIKWGNIHTGYRVIRKADGQMMSENHQSRTAALTWAMENKHRLAA